MQHNSILKFFSLFGLKRSFSASEIDQQVFQYLGKRKLGFYIEIGANNGIDQSNTKMLEVYYGWRGVLIEPIPKVFTQLRQNRSADNYFYNYACVSFGFPTPQMKMRYANLMTIGLQGNNHLLDPIAHAKEGAASLALNDSVHDILVEVRTLNSILEDVNAPSFIDLFSLDVEGAELEVLCGLDFSKYRFRALCIEIFQPFVIEMTKFLQSKGYLLVKQLSSHDYLFAHESLVGNDFF